MNPADRAFDRARRLYTTVFTEAFESALTEHGSRGEVLHTRVTRPFPEDPPETTVVFEVWFSLNGEFGSTRVFIPARKLALVRRSCVRNAAREVVAPGAT